MRNFPDLKLKLTLASITMFEKMCDKSFFDLADEDMPKLIYCVVRANNDFNYTFDVFMSMLGNKRFADTVVTEFKKIFDLMQDLFNKSMVSKINEQPEDNEQQEKSPLISDLASRLVVNVGLSPEYVYNQMELWQMQDLFNAYEEKEHRRLEEQRLWTYLLLMPSLDSKKKITPEQILPFAWDEDSKAKTVQEDFKKHEDIIRSVLGMKKKPEVSGDEPPFEKKEE